MTSKQFRRAAADERRRELDPNEKFKTELDRIAIQFRGYAFSDVGAQAFESFVAALAPAMPQKRSRSRQPP